MATQRDGDCGHTPMIEAVIKDHVDVMRVLLEHTPDAAKVTANGDNTAAHYAARYGQTEVLQLLLDGAPELAASTTYDGATLLHWAASSERPSTARLLLSAVPQTATACDVDRRTPLHNAAKSGATAMVQLLLAAAPAAALMPDGDGRLALHLAAQEKHVAVVSQLLAAAPEAVTTQDRQGNVALHFAAASNSSAMVAALLEAAPEAATVANFAGAPIHIAAYGATPAIVRQLLVAAPEAAALHDKTKSTALKVALNACRFDSTRCLLRTACAHGDHPGLLLAAIAAMPEWCDHQAPALFTEVVAGAALHRGQWARIPKPCPGLGCALPAVLERSAAEAAMLVARMTEADRLRLRTWALVPARVQRRLGISLPPPLASRLVALFDAP